MIMAQVSNLDVDGDVGVVIDMPVDVVLGMIEVIVTKTRQTLKEDITTRIG